MNNDEILARVSANFPQSMAALKELVAIPSISASAYDQSQLQRSAKWIAQKASALGLDTEVIQVQGEEGRVGRPAVLGVRPAEAGKPTVLLYAHHDVQPVGAADNWQHNSDPFTPVQHGDRLYGRGAADDKAGVVLHLAAIRAANPGVGIVLFVEGEEEIGSPTFVDFLAQYRDRLAADVIVVADSENWQVGTPSLTLSLRGTTQLVVTLSVLDHAVHSGAYSGPVIDPVTLAARLIDTLHDDAGDVAVAGLQTYTGGTNADYPEEQFRANSGLLAGVKLAGTGPLTERLWHKPTITVIGMDVTPLSQMANRISSSVTFALSLRVAPHQDPREAGEALAEHLRTHVPFGAHVDVQITEAGPGFIAAEGDPMTELAEEMLASSFGVAPVNIGIGGSIPFISELKRAFPQASILVTGVEDPDTRAHSENESLHVPDWQKAIGAEALLLSKLGE